MRCRTARSLVAVSAMGTLVFLTGCSSNGDNGDGAGEPETPDLAVSINPSSQFAPMFYGIEQGIFEEHGLELEIVPQTDVAAIVSGIASNNYDIGFATVVHVVTANANSIPIQAIASIEGQIQSDDEGTLTIASEASGITDFADLDGAQVATVGLSSMNTLTLQELADQAGVDTDSIELVQMPFGQMAAALEEGNVDAAVMQWPFAGEALDAGGVVLGANNREIYEGTATTLLNASESFIEQNPNTVQAFSDAMIESIEASSDNQDAARESLVDGMDITEEQAEDATWNVDSDPHLNLEAFETTQELLLKFTEDQSEASAIENVDVAELVWPGALEY